MDLSDGLSRGVSVNNRIRRDEHLAQHLLLALTDRLMMSRHRLILAPCSLVALAVAVIAFVSALETWPNSSIPLLALVGLGVVSAAIVAINFAFNFRR